MEIKRRAFGKTIVFLFLFLSLCSLADAERDAVYRVNIHGTIDLGLAHYVKRAVDEANAKGGKGILFDINTFGGRLDAATEIRDAIYSSRLPVAAYVDTRAWSAGALITLACPRILMSPGSSIGAAEPIPSTPKTISAVEGEIRSEAERYKRNPDIAAAMVNPDLDIPNVKKRGSILTLTADQAVADGFAEKVAAGDPDVLNVLSIRAGKVVDVPETMGEKFTRFVTNPDVSAILMTIGMLGIAAEIMTQHGIAGLVGLLSLGLFFGGYLIADLSNIWFVALFFAGVLLLLFELHVLPGHGVSGILGICAILASFFFVLGGNGEALKQLSFSLAITLVIFLSLLRYLPKAPVFSRLILKSTVRTPIDRGETLQNAKEDRETLIGKTGVTVSELRPSGIVLVEKERHSAIAEGEFIPAGAPIQVTGLQGSSLVVHSSAN